MIGRSASHRKLRQAAENEGIGKLTRTFGSVVYFVEKIIDEAAPAFELARLAETKDIPGLLAHRVLALQRGGPECAQLVAEARGTLEDASRFSAVAVDDDYDDDALVSPDERTRKLLLSAGMQALEELLAQRGDGGTT